MSGQAEILSLLSCIRPRSSRFRKIRIGSLGDGGYVLPDDLAGVTGVLSLGIGNEVSFDSWFADRKVPVYQYDHTVNGPPVPNDYFHFHKTALAPADGVDMLSLGSMVRRHGLDKTNDAILKMDVECAEWPVLTAIDPDVLKGFRIIACELHALNSLVNADFFQQARRCLLALSRFHTVVHLHANNCCGVTLIEGVPVPSVVEVTLLRNDRSEFGASDEPIPGPLDYPNMTDRPELVLRPFG